MVNYFVIKEDLLRYNNEALLGIYSSEFQLYVFFSMQCSWNDSIEVLEMLNRVIILHVISNKVSSLLFRIG